MGVVNGGWSVWCGGDDGCGWRSGDGGCETFYSPVAPSFVLLFYHQIHPQKTYHS